MKKILIILLFVNGSILAASNELREAKVRRYFLKESRTLLQELKNSTFFPELEKALNTLENGKLYFSWEDLYDNRQSLVDAIGVPGELTLDIKRIENYIRNDVNLSPLFLHELLRVSGVNDDSFHKTFELLSILPEVKGSELYCDLNIATTARKKILKSYSFSATTSEGFLNNNIIIINTSSSSAYTYKVLDQLLLENAKSKCLSKGYTDFEQIHDIGPRITSKECSPLKCEYKTQIKAKVRCVKEKVIKKKKSQVKSETCEKINTCIETINLIKDNSNIIEQNKKLGQQLKDLKC
ncbi:hypothetical protein [Bacteriovorax sp. Seq25_V]|uniref:hypothetical protein n=1 Tax=Bacteriovorax sp. Seq25_V TaxID=1201288 RepID=UPI00038A461C|nr:hypothetical protein [Bacteriovorax sp. Seq25_V]EQC45473.1 hypothetical protein M900_2176 [Bacteriovorax sp. Seq25_V]